MDPFGLLNLLKSAVSPAPNTEAPAPQPLPEQEQIPPEKTETANAFVDFMVAHDTRAKRTKKRP